MMKVCMQETESVMSALHSVAEAQLSPASRPRARTASLHANDQFHLPSAISATPATWNEGRCEFVPRLPRETKVDVRLCHAYHAKCRGVTGAQASPSAPPSAMSATPATQNDGRCEFVPRLPRKMTVDVSFATPATQNEGGCEVVPRLPRKVPRRHGRHGRPSQSKHATQCHECHACHAKRSWMFDCDTVAVRLCHACHAKRRWMWGCATPATQSAAASRASRATKPVQARHPVPWVPRLPRKTTVDVRLRHACHAKRRWMWVCATPATQSAAASRASRATKPVQARHPVPWVPRLPRKTTVDVRLWHSSCEVVPRLPRKTTVDVRLCHACHAKCHGVTGVTGVTGDQASPSTPPSAMSATPATQNDSSCEVVTRLPRKTTVDVSLCHACHAKCRGVTGVTGDQASPSAPPSAMSATPATQNDGGCEVVPRLPRKTCHACHAKRRWMWVCATPATQSAAALRASRATKPVQARHPVPWVPRLPRETIVDVRLWHACHAKRRWMWGCATPATQSAAASRATKPVQARHPVPWVPRLPRKTTVDVRLCHACHAKRRWMWVCATPATQRNMPEGPPLCMQMTHFTWLTRCSCGWVVCMLEMLSVKTSLTPCGIVQQEMILRRNMPEGPPLCMQMTNFTDWLVVVVVESYAC